MTVEVETNAPVVAETEKTDKELIAEEEMAAEAENDDAKDESKEEKQTKAPKKEKEKKPTVFMKDWEENKVYLYQSGRTPQIPSIVAKELKLETFLKLHGIPYENVKMSKMSLKKVKMPFIELNGEEILDGDIFPKLAEKFEKNLTANLTPEQANIEHAMIRMVENTLYWAIMDWRSETVDQTVKAYKINLPQYLDLKLPHALLNLHYKMNVTKKIQKRVKDQGFHDLKEQAKQDMKVLSEMLGDKEFMFGSEPSMLDLTMFSVLAQFFSVDADMDCSLRTHMNESFENLSSLFNRIKDKVWGEHWDEATGESLEVNPHIPKPEPEVKEEKEDEKEEGKEEPKEDAKEEANEEEKKDEEKKDEEEKKA